MILWVVGSRSAGKTTLIKALLRCYSRSLDAAFLWSCKPAWEHMDEYDCPGVPPVHMVDTARHDEIAAALAHPRAWHIVSARVTADRRVWARLWDSVIKSMAVVLVEVEYMPAVRVGTPCPGHSVQVILEAFDMTIIRSKPLMHLLQSAGAADVYDNVDRLLSERPFVAMVLKDPDTAQRWWATSATVWAQRLRLSRPEQQWLALCSCMQVNG